MPRYKITIEYGYGLKYETELERDEKWSNQVAVKWDVRHADGTTRPPKDLKFNEGGGDVTLRIFGHSVHSLRVERIGD